MKIYIIQDLEGVAGVFKWAYDLKKEGTLEESCLLMTEEINAAVDGAFRGGATEVFVHESHPFVFEKLDSRVKLVKGPLHIDGTFTAVFFVGQHAMAGIQDGILNHTGSSRSIDNVYLNGAGIGELGLVAAYAGEYRVPVGLVCGDEAVTREARELLTDCETVAVKKGTGQYSGISLSALESRVLIGEGARRALARVADFKPFRPEPPFELKIEYHHTSIVDECLVIPGLERINSRTTVCRTATFTEIYRFYLSQGLVLRRIDAY